MIRVAIISHVWFKDYPYLQEYLEKLAAVHGEVILIHGGEPLRYGMFINDWCKKHDNFTEIAEYKDVHLYGAGAAGKEQARRMLAHKPDEVWKFENSPGSRRRPDHAIFPEFWAMAAAKGVTCRVFRYFTRRMPNRTYVETPQLDSNGFPVPVRVRVWDAERNGVTTRSKKLQGHRRKG